jgi:hypothetical protein
MTVRPASSGINSTNTLLVLLFDLVCNRLKRWISLAVGEFFGFSMPIRDRRYGVESSDWRASLMAHKNQSLGESYDGLLEGVVRLLEQARRTSARSVNAL